MQSLEQATATRRHIILLTDGWSSSGQYADILARMKADGITLSTVGAGGGANPFLEQLAKQGGGRYYAAANPASIPDIFLKETQQVSGEQIVEEPFYPILTSSSPILRGLDSGFPQLLGYNGTTAKPAAQTVLVTDRDDPLLAQWQYGLGRAVAWTSDSTGRWAKSWIGWQGFSKFFSQLVGWTFPGEESGGIEAAFVDRGGRTYLRVHSVRQRRFGTRLLRHLGCAGRSGPGAAHGQSQARWRPACTRRRSPRSRAARTPCGSPRPSPGPRRWAEPWVSWRRRPPSTGSSGANQAFMAAIGAATGGSTVGLRPRRLDHTTWRPRPASPTCGRGCSCSPCCCGRSTSRCGGSRSGGASCADGRRWITDRVRGRRVAARTRPVEGMLAARDRAGSAGARTAILREAAERPVPQPDATATSVPAAVASTSPASPEIAQRPIPPVADTAPVGPAGSVPVDADTMARLREAKRRARG